MAEEVVDQKARTQAALARQKIESHESNCADRWRQARDEMRSVNTLIRWLVGLVIIGQGAVIGILVTALLRAS